MDTTSAQVSPPQQMRNIWKWAVEGRTGRGVPPLLLLILVAALALRLYGINWDQGNLFHPDERSVYMRVDCMYRLLTKAPSYQDCNRDAPFQRAVPGFPSPTVFLDAARSPLNPHWFPLGTMILYVMLAIKLVLAPIVSTDLQDLAIAGRTLSALADVGTVALVYALGRRLYGRGAGLLAAALVAFAVVHIQHSHYYRPETFTILFVMASFWFMLQVLERQRLRDSLWLGLFVGLAFATKVSVLPLLLSLAVVYGRLLWLAVHNGGTGAKAEQAERVALCALAAGAVAVAAYLFWTPYAVLDFPEFLEWNLRELDIVRHAGIVPYTVQYMGAPKFLYEFQQTTMWGMGLPLGLLAWGGLLATAAINLRRPRLGQVLLLLWTVPLLLTVGSVEVKFLRYTFPLVPPLILMGSGAAWAGMRWLENRHKILGMAAAVAIGLVLASTAFYALAFQSVYSQPHTAVQASAWINANVPVGAQILTDNHWDEGIPDLGRYRVTQLPMFEGDTPQKIGFVASDLASADYLVFYSNRTYGAIARVPERYPFSSNYYRLLFSGDIGYELVTSFDSYPRLLGVAFVDDPFDRAGLPVPKPLAAQSPAPLSLDLGYADNDAITYDRPLVMVFKNTARYDANRLITMLLKPTVTVEPKPALMLTPEELAQQQQGGTWSDLFYNDSLANRFPVVVWLLLVEAASLAALPLGFLVFRGLSDRGYLLTKTLAVLLLAYIPWLLAA
ncbi:MAG: glycosyltransferase family 39 protein, partial [Chloroflexota bacterium]